MKWHLCGINGLARLKMNASNRRGHQTSVKFLLLGKRFVSGVQVVSVDKVHTQPILAMGNPPHRHGNIEESSLMTKTTLLARGVIVEA